MLNVIVGVNILQNLTSRDVSRYLTYLYSHVTSVNVIANSIRMFCWRRNKSAVCFVNQIISSVGLCRSYVSPGCAPWTNVSNTWSRTTGEPEVDGSNPGLQTKHCMTRPNHSKTSQDVRDRGFLLQSICYCCYYCYLLLLLL